MNPEITTVDVCVCTYRRDAIRQTLASLAGQNLPSSVAMRVVVADNDATPSAADLVANAAAGLGLSLTYVHAPASNISIARNAALGAAHGDWIAFIDDDETAASDWLAQLLAAASATGADVVFGPVRPVFQETPPAWLSDGSFHAVEPTFKDGVIVSGYAGNALISRRFIEATSQRFDVAFGQTGGEDTDFFERLIKLGAVMHFCANALVLETVPPDRASLDWLCKRRIRYGQIHGAMIARQYPTRIAQLRETARAGLKVIGCLGGLMLNPFPRRRRAFWLLRGALHLGVILKLTGGQTIAGYGATGSTAPLKSPDHEGR